MSNDILLYPSISNDMRKKIRFQTRPYIFFYLDKNEDEHILETEPVELSKSVNNLVDDGVWNQNEYKLGIKRLGRLATTSSLFGAQGVACKTATLGIAVIWTSSDSKQRGAIPVATFDCRADNVEIRFSKIFERAQLRGEVNFTTVIYIAADGTPEDNERHLANSPGTLLGELDSYTIRLDGNKSMFPVFEVSMKNQPLWFVKCDWEDATTDLFEDYVSININTAHKNYKYLDISQKTYNPQLMAEVMAAAISIIIEKVRLNSAEWEQIMNNEDIETGSVGQAIYYFMETLGWEMETPESVSLSARRFFDQRMK